MDAKQFLERIPKSSVIGFPICLLGSEAPRRWSSCWKALCSRSVLHLPNVNRISIFIVEENLQDFMMRNMLEKRKTTLVVPQIYLHLFPPSSSFFFPFASLLPPLSITTRSEAWERLVLVAYSRWADSDSREAQTPPRDDLRPWKREETQRHDSEDLRKRKRRERKKISKRGEEEGVERREKNKGEGKRTEAREITEKRGREKRKRREGKGREEEVAGKEKKKTKRSKKKRKKGVKQRIKHNKVSEEKAKKAEKKVFFAFSQRSSSRTARFAEGSELASSCT